MAARSRLDDIYLLARGDLGRSVYRQLPSEARALQASHARTQHGDTSLRGRRIRVLLSSFPSTHAGRTVIPEACPRDVRIGSNRREILWFFEIRKDPPTRDPPVSRVSSSGDRSTPSYDLENRGEREREISRLKQIRYRFRDSICGIVRKSWRSR